MDHVRVTSTRTFLTFYRIGYIEFGKGYGATWKHMFLYAGLDENAYYVEFSRTKRQN